MSMPSGETRRRDQIGGGSVLDPERDAKRAQSVARGGSGQRMARDHVVDAFVLDPVECGFEARRIPERTACRAGRRARHPARCA